MIPGRFPQLISKLNGITTWLSKILGEIPGWKPHDIYTENHDLGGILSIVVEATAILDHRQVQGFFIAGFLRIPKPPLLMG